MINDITQVLVASSLDTFKNTPSAAGSVTVPSQNYTASQRRSFDMTIPLRDSNATTMLLLNFSFQPSRWWVSRFSDFQPSADFLTFTTTAQQGSNLIVTVIVTNATAGTVALTGFTVEGVVRQFVAPF